MKLILQIFFAVFLANLASGLLLDLWRQHQAQLAQKAAEQALIAQEKARLERNDQIRALFIQGQRDAAKAGNAPTPSLPAFVPDDQTPPPPAQ